MSGFLPGSLVRFRAPAGDAERAQRFRVVEDRGPRTLVRAAAWSAGPLPPTFVYATDDLELAACACRGAKKAVSVKTDRGVVCAVCMGEVPAR